MTRELVHRMGSETAPVVIGSGILESLASHVRSLRGGKDPSGILIVSDCTIRDTWGEIVARSWTGLQSNTVSVRHVSITATESQKSAQSWAKILDEAVQAGLDRQGLIVAVGGGITTDLAGFAAASYMRGIKWVAVPTTLLGMVDAALGGKTGINLPVGAHALGKNLAGAFWSPSAVFADVMTLTTLSQRHFRAGLAEGFKHAMLADPSIDAHLSEAAAHFADPQPVHQWRLIDLVARAAAVKLEIVAADPRESDKRMLLNLGHTFAHAIESQCAEELLHGEAVAIGLVAAASASVAAGRMTVDQAKAVAARLEQLGLPTRLPRRISIESLENAAGFDKKRAGGALTLILPRGTGGADVVSSADPQLLRLGLRTVGASESP